MICIKIGTTEITSTKWIKINELIFGEHFNLNWLRMQGNNAIIDWFDLKSFPTANDETFKKIGRKVNKYNLLDSINKASKKLIKNSSKSKSRITESTKRHSKIINNPPNILKDFKSTKVLKRVKVKKLKSKIRLTNDAKMYESNDRLNADSKCHVRNENAVVKYHKYLTSLKSTRPKSK
jgi:hypothetical protein